MRLKRYLKEELLLEKTFSIGRDVNFIYKEGYFEKFLKEVHKYKLDPNGVDKLLNKSYFKSEIKKIKDGKSVMFTQIKSEQLKSKDCQMAHKLNPCIIDCGVFTDGSWYRPKKVIHMLGAKDFNYSHIQVSLHHNAFNIALNFNTDYVPPQEYKVFVSEFNPVRAKESIAHEISHWLNDTMHNYHISDLVVTAQELNRPDMLKLGKKNVNMTHFELDAQIHAIKQLKMKYKKDIWNLKTLRDVFIEYASLWSIAQGLYKEHGKEVFNIWQKALIKRMDREKLLGKNMRNFVKPEEI